MTDQGQFELGEFRKALGSFTTGVTVVTTRGTEENDIGLTANSFNSVSLDPPMVLWSLGKSALSMPHFREAKYFAVHILSEDQEDLSGQFAKRGVDKFANVEFERGPADIPLLKHCAARFVCKTAYQYEGGDHIIFVGEVIDFTHWDRLPLLFHGGQYGQINKNQNDAMSGGDGAFEEASLGYLLRLSGHQIFSPLKAELSKRALSVPQYHCLALLAKYSSKPLDEVLAMLELGDAEPTKAEMDDLIRRGLVHDVDGEIDLTPEGARLHVELVAIYKASESVALNELDYEMRQTLNLALMKLIETTSFRH